MSIKIGPKRLWSPVLSFLFLTSPLTFAESVEKNCMDNLIAQVVQYKGAKSLQFVNATADTKVQKLPENAVNQIHVGDWVTASLVGDDNVKDIDLIFRNSQQLYGYLQKGPDDNPEILTVIGGRRTIVKLKTESKKKKGGLPFGKYVRLNVDYKKSTSKHLMATFDKVYGTTLPENEVEELVMAQFGQKVSHAPKAEQQMDALLKQKNYLKSIIEAEIAMGRKDLRSLPLRSIDNVTTTDYDDLIYTERLPNGNYKVYVAISDVTQFYKDKDPIAREVYDRYATAYYPEKRFPLFPLKAEQKLFSLSPDDDRLAVVAEMEIDQTGATLSTELYEAVVRNKKAWNYEEVDRMMAEQRQHEFSLDLEVYEKIHARRRAEDTIYLNRKMSEIGVNPEDIPAEYHVETLTTESHEMIAEFMINANVNVGKWIEEQGFTAPYRSQVELTNKSLQTFLSKAESLGYYYEGDNANFTGKNVGKFLAQVENQEDFQVLVGALKRSFKVAYYSGKPEIHSTLNMRTYVHFTSPIRRAPDLIVHRVIKEILHGNQPPTEEQVKKWSQHFSVKTILEKRRDYFFQQVELLKEFKYNLRNVKNKTLPATITDVNEAVIVVRYEGLDMDLTIPIFPLRKKRFKYFEKEHSISNGKHTFSIGDEVEIKIGQILPELREVDTNLIIK